MEAMEYRNELLRQIDEKERERIGVHEKKFKEGEAQRLEQELRKSRIQETITKKINDLKVNKVPEKYVSDIQRHSKLIQNM